MISIISKRDNSILSFISFFFSVSLKSDKINYDVGNGDAAENMINECLQLYNGFLIPEK